MSWWTDFWHWADTSPLGATVVGGVIVAAVLAVAASFSKVRKPVAAAARRFWAFVCSIRLTTTKRIEAEARREIEAPQQRQVFQLVPVGEYHAMQKAIKDAEERQETSDPGQSQSESPRLGQNDPATDTAHAETPDPVSWSASFRGGFNFVLTNVSKTVTAYHVRLRSTEITSLPTSTSTWYWPELPPKMTAEFIAMPRMGRRQGEPLWIRVVWEDAERLAHEEKVYVVGV